MNKAANKILSLLLAVCLMLGGLAVTPVTAYAAAPQDVQSGAAVTLNTPGLYDISTADNGATITVTVDGVALTGTHANLSVTISGGITLTLKDASITSTSGNAIWVDGAGCGLVLIGDNSATSGPGYAGVCVQEGTPTRSLTITALAA